MSHSKMGDGFMELAEFRLGGGKEPEMPSSVHNVLKKSRVIRKGVEEVGLGEEHQDDPMVFVQRDGDRVTSVDFLCKCGRSASLRLEYDEE
jgi:hypothetical protein